MQDALNQILSNPEAMKQVQSLGEQLGLNKPAPKPEPKKSISICKSRWNAKRSSGKIGKDTPRIFSCKSSSEVR